MPRKKPQDSQSSAGSPPAPAGAATLPAIPGTIAAQLLAVEQGLAPLLADAESARATWRTLQPLADRVIGILREQVELAARGNAIDLSGARKLLDSITNASKSLAASAVALTSTYGRMVEARDTLGGGTPKNRDLSKLGEHELRRIVGETVRELGLGPVIDVTPRHAAEGAAGV